VAAWLASAGVNTADPRVLAETEALALAAQRALRTRQRETGAVVFSRSSFTGGGGPFSSVAITAGGSTTPGRLALVLFAAFWLAVLAAGLLHLLRTTRPPVRTR
jgi:hypothetical protein